MAKRYTKAVEEGLSLVRAHAQAVMDDMGEDQDEDKKLMAEALEYLQILQFKKRKKPNAVLSGAAKK